MSLVQKMIGAATLNVNVYEQVEADESATSEAMIVVVLSSLAAGIGAIGGSGGVLAIVGAMILSLVGWVIWAFLSYLIGTKVLPEPTTQADVGQLLRTTGFAQSPGLLRVFGIIPFLGVLINFVVGVWMLIAMVIAVRQALDYKSTPRAIGVVVIGWLVFMVVTVGGALMLGLVAAGIGSIT